MPEQIVRSIDQKQEEILHFESEHFEGLQKSNILQALLHHLHHLGCPECQCFSLPWHFIELNLSNRSNLQSLRIHYKNSSIPLIDPLEITLESANYLQYHVKPQGMHSNSPCLQGNLWMILYLLDIGRQEYQEIVNP